MLRPDNESRAPEVQEEAAEIVREAFAAGRAIYPIGGGTSLDFGLPPPRPGIELSLASLARVVDYPHRDLTVTVEAGLRVAELSRLLADHNQWLPIDVPAPDQATVGGALAVNASGSRRYGQGTLRDYLIGVTAIDGRGTTFHAGGRVVKNVAGYDLGKLLIGSLGTIGVVTQATFKVKPRPQAAALLACAPRNRAQVEAMLAGLGRSLTTPTSIDWLIGAAWAEMGAEFGFDHAPVGLLVAGLEGSEDEVPWMARQLAAEWKELDDELLPTLVVDPAALDRVWVRLRDFPKGADDELVLKISAPPSAIAALAAQLVDFDPRVTALGHAGNGILVARFREFPPAMVSRWLIGTLQQSVLSARGHVVVLRGGGLKDLTRQAVWGPVGDELRLMQAVKREFDPADILNPGRFVFETR